MIMPRAYTLKSGPVCDWFTAELSWATDLVSSQRQRWWRWWWSVSERVKAATDDAVQLNDIVQHQLPFLLSTQAHNCCCIHWHRHTHTRTHTHTRLTALCPGLPGWAGTRNVKPFWILLKQETVSGSGISWAVCKYAPRSRQITTPAPHYSVFYRPDGFPTNSVKALKATWKWNVKT